MKLVTYNIQYTKGKDYRYDVDRIVQAVKGADVIALQEVERFWKRSGMTDQPAEIAKRLSNYYWIYTPACDMDACQKQNDGTILNRRRQFGTMILSKKPILSSRLHTLPKFGSLAHYNMATGALEAVIQFSVGPIRIYSLHLSAISLEERLIQIKALLKIHRQAVFEGGVSEGPPLIRSITDWSDGVPLPPKMPQNAILCGDFNSEPGGPEYDALVGRKDRMYGRVPYIGNFVDAWVAGGNREEEGITRPKDKEISDDRKLDYFMISSELAGRVKKSWIDELADGSNHQPVWVEMDI